MTGPFRYSRYWIVSLVTLAVWLALGWPFLNMLMSGEEVRGSPVPALWLLPFAILGATALAVMLMKLRTRLQWILIGVQVAAVVAMAIFVNWAMVSMFLIIVAWQVPMATSPPKALAWVIVQTLVIVATLALVPTPDVCWVIWMSFGLQLCALFTATALRREADTARALADAQAVIATTARDAERLRISRELHDAWGHELTALGLQLEIASHVGDATRANEHVMKAKVLSKELLAKVRDVVSTLREAERCDLREALEALARRVPRPAIQVDIARGVQVSPEQAHALICCAQEAVTNAIKHAEAENLWLQVVADGDGVRLLARDDGKARPSASSSGASPGSGLLGMRERLECLGGRLAVRKGADFGFTVDVWLPLSAPQSA